MPDHPNGRGHVSRDPVAATEAGQYARTVELERGIAGHGRDIVTITDVEGRVVYASPNLGRVLGHAPEARQGRLIFELIHPEDLPVVRRVYEDLLRSSDPFELSVRVGHADGSWRWLEGSGRPFEGSGGDLRCLIVSRDVTAPLQRAHLQRREMDALRALVEGVPPREVLATVVSATADLSPSLSASVLLLHNDGRCLRTAAAAGLPAEHLHGVDAVSTGPGSSPCALAVRRAEPVYIEDIEGDPRSAGTFRERARALGLRACWTAPARMGDGTVVGTFTLYGRVPGPPGVLEVQLLEAGARVVALVVQRERLEPEHAHGFAERARRLCSDVVHQAGRVLAALPADHPADGEARLLLATTRQIQSIEPELAAIGSAEVAAPAPSPAHVLVVDDDEAIRSLLFWVLRRAGYEVTTAVDGRDALDRAEAAAGQFGLVVLDWRMPGMDGGEVLQALRRRWTELPVLICSGQGDPRAALGPELRATVSFLAKPFDPRDLVERVRGLLSASERAVR